MGTYERRSSSGRLMLAVLLCLSCLHAAAAEAATLGIGVRVVSRAAASGADVEVPVPPGAKALAAGAGAEIYAYDGDAAAAARFFQARMAGLGYRLVAQDGNGTRQRWANAAYRIDVDLDPVLGRAAATRILIRKQMTSAISQESTTSG